MTRGEAIKRLKEILDVLDTGNKLECRSVTIANHEYCRTIEALEMSIEALKEREQFTYDEQCIFLSAIEKERRAIKGMKTYIFGGGDKKRLDRIVDEIERKVKAALWEGEE